MPKGIEAIGLRSWLGSIGLAIVIGTASFFAAHLSLAGIAAALFAVAMSTLVLAVLFAERRSYAAALKDSHDRLRLALDGAELGVWSADLTTGRFESDVRDRQINGHGAAAPARTLAEARALIHPDDRGSLDALFAASARSGASYKAEYRLAAHADRPQGRERWVEVSGTVARGADGHPARLLGVTRDITERKVAEQRLRESERKFREILGALPAAIYVTDGAGRITYCNQNAIDLWQAEPRLGEENPCDHCRISRADGTTEACPTKIVLKEGKVERGRDLFLDRPDGTRIPILHHPAPLHDHKGTITGVVSMMVDVTERQSTARALAERNVQLALAGKAGLVGSYTYVVNSDKLLISEGYAAIHGLPEGVVETSRAAWARRVHPEDVARVLALRDRAIQERRSEFSLEYRIVRQGEVRWLETRNFIHYDGVSPYVIGVHIDITDRKRAEERQRVLLAELDHRVKNVLATVNAIASRTKDASRSMEEFVTALDGRIRSMASAHELLSSRRWRGMPITELVGRELAAYATRDNAELDGPEVMLPPEAGQAMAMVVHELATNAAKHGALSTQTGRVSVRWSRGLDGGSPLVLVWRETGGPRVAAPRKAGLGTSIVRELIPYELGGAVDFSFAPEGVECRVEIPLERIGADRANGSGPQSLHHPEPSIQ